MSTKEEREAQKKARAAARGGGAVKKEEDLGENFGLKHPVGFSVEKWTNLGELQPSLKDQHVWIRARVQTIRGKGNVNFFLLRQRFHSVQAVIAKSDTVTKAVLKFVQGLTKESIVDIYGLVTVPQVPIEAATQKEVEIQIQRLFVVSLAENLPLLLEDASRSEILLEEQARNLKEIDDKIAAVQAILAGKEGEEKETLEKQIAELIKSKDVATKFVVVDQSTRLDNRIIDLRTQANQAIFRLQSVVGTLFRQYLLEQGFTEIHSPKLLSAASEGGASVFEVKYFDGKAYLAQSPQLYKQMAICADFDRVFEVGPVFRSESSFTHRHLTEFTGLDLEMAFHLDYHEVLSTIEALFRKIFTGIEENYQHELQLISQQYPFTPFRFNKQETLRITFAEGIKLLREAGFDSKEFEDIGTTEEKALGKIIKEKYNVDFYVMEKYPTGARPFYTMLDPTDSRYTNSYDIFMRGEEISSGSQRVHIPSLLEERAKANNVEPQTIRSYIDSFRFGAPPHAGCGVGLERVVMLYLGLHNIRKTSLFPRDPSRLTP